MHQLLVLHHAHFAQSVPIADQEQQRVQPAQQESSLLLQDQQHARHAQLAHIAPEEHLFALVVWRDATMLFQVQHQLQLVWRVLLAHIA